MSLNQFHHMAQKENQSGSRPCPGHTEVCGGIGGFARPPGATQGSFYSASLPSLPTPVSGKALNTTALCQPGLMVREHHEQDWVWLSACFPLSHCVLCPLCSILSCLMASVISPQSPSSISPYPTSHHSPSYKWPVSLSAIRHPSLTSFISCQ